MHVTWKERLRAAFPHWPTAVRLARAAENGGVDAKAASVLPGLLAGVGLDLDDVDSLDVHRAQELANDHSRALDVYGRKRARELPPPAADAALGGLNAELPKRRRDVVLGFAATAVVRWMGSQHWTPAMADAALRANGVEMNRGTLYAQLAAGRKGERGAPAPLTPTQAKALEVASGSASE